ncbi:MULTISPECIES: glutathione S-transferase N-terminal domain-containing protein [unclassified Candidatus Frackibacter]|uniref:glutathione S-transferase N-terminal domain-containing protein n=1 Tax=unclassified Candidatus Frackibacter TaxID=2648818 RepID=UPI0008828513|nr:MULTISPECIES: glutathione S-transferase N-terminal domain-containing protein [unclassified Candidatus Frackibacter]SDC47951.1 Glutathione S-transferase, N-terminal domain [Candidatus Frackibacter sp. WG11]SEM95345.1 Glutathione S-transferase, N-terminal domain [Candidatus Frackibacter sp. WG12]SFL73169.1 Glutathione S-transferase, N-terminal domain [Candidatus Frackibacter sp. WG13]
MIKLYQFETCPFCIKVRKKLDELNLNYETVEVSRDRAKRTKIKELSGQIKVPVLEDSDGTVVYDSSRIVEYLEDNY